VKTLERRLGLGSVIAIAVSAMLGSGIFVLPGLAAAKAGPSVWLAYVVAGICVIPAALSKSELATAMPASGGSYVYLDRAFGPMVGTIAGIGLWLSLLLKSAFALIGFGAYLYVFSDLPLVPTALVLLAAVTWLNILGVKKVGKAQVTIVVVSLIGLLLLAVGGVRTFDASRFSDLFSEGSGGFIAAIGFVYISYAGVTKIAAIAEEIKDPNRNIPRGILISLALVTATYGLIVLVMVGVLPMDGFVGDIRPIYSLGVAVGGPVVGVAAAVLAVVTLTSMANAGLLAASRFPFAMSRDHLLPDVFKAIHPRYITPVSCILATAAAMAAAILFLDIERIVKVASALMLMAFTASNAAVILLRETSTSWYRPPYRSPFYPWTQIIGILLGLVLLVMLGWLSLIAITAVGVPGGLLFVLYGRNRTDRTSIFRKLGPRQELLIPDAGGLEVNDALPDTAAVVVSIFGHERSPETLVEVGASIAMGRRLEVLYVTEIPEQTILGAMLEDDIVASSLKRRVKTMSERDRVDAEFNAVVSRDVLQTVTDATASMGCEWLVTEWPERGGLSFTRFNPLGWLVNHLPCNLALFKDAGIHKIRKILVLAEPGPDDVLVSTTADHLAESYAASLTFGCYVKSNETDQGVDEQVAYYAQLRDLCISPSDTIVMRGSDEIEAYRDLSPGFDLLVMGGSREHGFLKTQFGGHRDKLASQVACSVLRLRTPREQTHQAFDYRKAVESGQSVDLVDLVDPSCVQARIADFNKDALFAYFADIFSGVVEGVEPSEIEAALWERERTQNTAIGDGLAMPHAALSGSLQSHLGVFTSATPIDYRAPDGEGVDVFFVLVGPASDRGTHLMLLSSLARLTLQTDLIEQLRAAPTSEEMMTIIRENSEALS
jgi:amino acid transporter/mannitol/fructose-specific phosphotransferase system IIA component (Ntr-type)/nucleotide-binding universal stress UspA family protein